MFIFPTRLQASLQSSGSHPQSPVSLPETRLQSHRPNQFSAHLLIPPKAEGDYFCNRCGHDHEFRYRATDCLRGHMRCSTLHHRECQA